MCALNERRHQPSAHRIDLPPDGVACHRSACPPFRRHGAQPGRTALSQWKLRTPGGIRMRNVRLQSMQCEMRRAGNCRTCQQKLELRSRTQMIDRHPKLSEHAAQIRQLDNFVEQRGQLNGQAFATFGAPRIDDGATTTGLHANQKTMRTSAAGFRRLISAFHDYLKCVFSNGKAACETSLVNPARTRATARSSYRSSLASTALQ